MSQVLINESTLQDIADKIRCFQPMTTKTVIGYYYNVTKSWGHTVNLSSYFPNLNYSYFLLTSGYQAFNGPLTFYQDGISDTKVYLDANGAARVLISAQGKNLQYQEIVNYGDNKSLARFIVYPLDQNMNFIIYNASQHGSLPTRTVTWYFPSSQLYYPNEFANKIGGSRVYPLQVQVGTGDYYNRYIADPVNNNYYRPWQDLRFYGVHDITDIKLLVISGRSNYNDVPFFSASFMTPVDKGDPWGLGFPLKWTTGNYTYPQGGSSTIHLKDNRLWLPTWSGTSDFACSTRGQQGFLVV